MGMWTTANQDTFDLVLKTFVDTAHKNYDYAYTTGYLQSMCVEMIALLPKRKQKEFIDSMITATQSQEQRLIKKMNENQVFERA